MSIHIKFASFLSNFGHAIDNWKVIKIYFQTTQIIFLLFHFGHIIIFTRDVPYIESINSPTANPVPSCGADITSQFNFFNCFVVFLFLITFSEAFASACKASVG